MTKGPRLYSPYDATMWESVERRSLELQRCGSCSVMRYPPGPACPDCGSTEVQWTPISGRGKLLSWTRFHRQYLPAYPAPSVVVAVQLEEGPIMVTNTPADAFDDLTLDGPVKLDYATHPDGYTIPVFHVAGQG